MPATPAVVLFGFSNYVTTNNCRKASCKFCGTECHDSANTTSNFVRHLKTRHPDHFKTYIDSKSVKSTSNQPTLEAFVPSCSQRYARDHSKQKAISKAIVENLIVDCALPLSIVEHPSFREFLFVMDQKYSPIGRTAAVTHISTMATEMETALKFRLSKITYLSVTTDIWTDRVMRGFLGVTGHFIEDQQLQSVLLSCQRIVGSHTAERIALAFDEVLVKYNVKEKLQCILTDNAANMKKAFNVSFPSIISAEEEEEAAAPELNEDPEIWVGLDSHEETKVKAALARRSKIGHLPCFAHTLQLVLHDGLKHSGNVSSAIAKCTKISTLLHTSPKFKDEYSDLFDVGIPAAIVTRWNSTFKQVSAILRLDSGKLSDLLSKHGHVNHVLSSTDWAQLKELQTILLPFAEATDLTQGEKIVTISVVAPCVIGIYNSLVNASPVYLEKMVEIMRESLMRRFHGILASVKLVPTEEQDKQSQTYLIASALDPRFNETWLEMVRIGDQEKESLTEEIRASVISEIKPQIALENEKSSNPAPAVSKTTSSALFPFLGKFQASPKPPNKTPAIQYHQYVAAAREFDPSLDVIFFWASHHKEFPDLTDVALRVLSTPASSAPVERVFSAGGILLRPHRASMGDRNLSNLIFLKCNRK